MVEQSLSQNGVAAGGVSPATTAAAAAERPHHFQQTSYFPTVRHYVEELEGFKVIEKVLIANNGIAAVKGIRSIRKWCYETFGSQRAIKFVVMATPEDIRANAEYVRLADELVQVPGEGNRNNYANVKLIVDIAQRTQCDAVWPGWGHSSENPDLPTELSKLGIAFVGPRPKPMHLLGDKISSTILAQSAGVPTIPWSGTGLQLQEGVNCHRDGDGIIQDLSEDVFDKACVRSYEEAEAVALERVGYPLMIKASEGGGGKGIRKVEKPELLKIAYEQVTKEVAGSPIFLMKLSSRSRHLEVQLVGDEYNQAIALKSRDCSVQRRHQKILEEGPVTIVKEPSRLRELENAAVRLARSVGYSCAGTVEYLYEIDTGNFYFLELNPRIQVEHPVTEWITGTNVPSIQLQVAMGIPLHRIPDVRRFYGRKDGHGEGEGVTCVKTAGGVGSGPLVKKTYAQLDPKYFIDFDNQEPVPALGHCIAARITAENPDEGFQPTSGNVTELTFRNTPNVWGYFSIRSQGQIHAYSDSQFGHIFAFGENREKARHNLALALSEISIRGDIRNTAEYLSQLIEKDMYLKNEFTTEWLDGIIKNAQSDKEKLSSSPASPTQTLSASGALVPSLDKRTFLNIICGACHTIFDRFKQNTDKWYWFIERGQHPPEDLLNVLFKNVELIYQNVKYVITGAVSGPNRFAFCLNDSYVEAEVKVLRDGGLLVLLPATGESHTSYAQQEPNGNLRVMVDSKISLFTKEFDPSEIRANMSGKLVRYLVRDGSHVKANEAFAEMEMMKMIMTTFAQYSGTIKFQMVEGSTVNQGDIIAVMDLDDKSSIKRATLFEGKFPTLTREDGAAVVAEDKSANNRLRDAQEEIYQMLAGYDYPDALFFQRRLDEAIAALQVIGSLGEADQAATQSSASQRGGGLLLNEFIEKLAVLKSAIPKSLLRDISTLLSSDSYMRDASEKQLMDKMDETFDKYFATQANDEVTRQTKSAIYPLLDIIEQHKKGYKNMSFAILSNFVKEYIRVEKTFDSYTSGKALVAGANATGNQTSTTSLLLELRYRNKDDLKSIYDMALSHERVRNKNRVLVSILREAERIGLGNDFVPLLKDLSNFISKPYSDIALIAKQLLHKTRLPSMQRVQREMEKMFHDAIAAGAASQPGGSAALLKDIIERSNYSFDVLITFFNHPNVTIRNLAQEVYVRKAYITFDVTMLGQEEAAGSWRSLQWRFVNKVGAAAAAPGLLSHKRDGIVGSISTDSLAGLGSPLTPTGSGRGSFGSVVDTAAADGESEDYVGFGSMTIFNSIEDIETNLGAILDKVYGKQQQGDAEHSNVMSIVLMPAPRSSGQAPASTSAAGSKKDGQQQQSDSELIEHFNRILKSNDYRLGAYDIKRVTAMVVPAEGQHPLYYTFRQHINYAEDPIYRHLEPTLAFQLALRKMSNYQITPLTSIKNQAVHVFFAEKKPERRLPGSASRQDPFGKRYFVRTLVLQGDIFTPDNPDEFQISEAERYLVESLNALELAMADPKYDLTYFNHIFINILPEIVVNTDMVTTVISRFQNVYAKRLWKLRVGEVELRMFIKTSLNDPQAIPLRFIATNKTGYNLVVDIYQEVKDPITGRSKYSALIAGSDNEKDNLSGKDINTPHPVPSGVSLKRRMAHNNDTCYVYDFPYLFERSLKGIWKHYAQVYGYDLRRVLPKGFLVAREMVLNEATMELEYKKPRVGENGEEEMSIGDNKYGMVAWRLTAKTPEYPAGRDVIVIVNDITFQSGSFGPMEDVIFQKASEISRLEGLPRFYIAANSGARIGLADEVKALYRVAWKENSDGSDTSRGFEYLYLTEQDYLYLKDMEQSLKLDHAIVNAEPIDADVQDKQTGELAREKRYRITDIIGKTHGLGVENLQGSGLIAGETSRAYADVFTLNYVAARTVGIGAYLVRLGQRVIQHRKPPILLTGAAALNKVLGREVYSSNNQLGGIQIMHPNGVTHMVANDDLKAIRMMLDWLSYVPEKVGAPLPVRSLSGTAAVQSPTSPTAASLHVDLIDTPSTPADTGVADFDLDIVEREIEFAPQSQQQYDVRHMIAGQCLTTTDDRSGNVKQKWVSGMFDKGSFMETLGGWAKNVVVGRARLGGIPLGVIAVDVGTYQQVIPADPADPTTQERIIQKAGPVWFPDSAYKTAQAIRDFNNGEELPLMILANWRGFSGGQRDMFEEVLKFGSYIVDALVDYKRPVFVYIPPFGELRGGAWVVVDSAINPDFMEMYADKQARGGVLEPSGIVEIKYRHEDVVNTIRRLDPVYVQMSKQLGSQSLSLEDKQQLQAKMKQREKQVLPIYHNISLSFADLHDTAGRMKAKKVTREVLEWRHARKYFFWRLKRRLAELELMDRIEHSVRFPSPVDKKWDRSQQRRDVFGSTFSHQQKLSMIREWIFGAQSSEELWQDDRAVIQWLEQHRVDLERHLQQLREEYVRGKVTGFCASSIDSTIEGLLGYLNGDKCDQATRSSVIDKLQKQLAILKLGFKPTGL